MITTNDIIAFSLQYDERRIWGTIDTPRIVGEAHAGQKEILIDYRWWKGLHRRKVKVLNVLHSGDRTRFEIERAA